jgi:hypothetical protein
MIKHFNLKDYKIKKGILISPFNELMTPLSKESSWFTGRCPEYLWIGLILNAYERKEAINKCLFIIEKLSKIEPNLASPAWSEIIEMDKDKQDSFFSYLSSYIDTEILTPITCITNFSDSPSFNNFFSPSLPLDERINKLINLMNMISDHQSEKATDIRYIVLYHNIQSGKMHISEEVFDSINKYRFLAHDDEEMKMIRPTIRSMEQIILNDFNKIDNQRYLENFWNIISQSTDCNCLYIKLEEKTVDTKYFIEKFYNVCKYYQELVQIQPLNNKLLVLSSIAVYSYKRLLELVDHSLFNEISGRSIARNIIENYIMMKYLIKHEKEHEDIWSEFQYYGIGKIKLIVQKDREKNKTKEENHLNYEYLQILIGEYTREDFLNMDLRYFDNLGIRDKAIDVDEKDLYDLLYDYDSQYEHGLWGAIRESSLIKCDNPAHQYHCIPDIENVQKLPSVWNDCCQSMKKIVNVLRNEFGLPKHLEIEEIV